MGYGRLRDACRVYTAWISSCMGAGSVRLMLASTAANENRLSDQSLIGRLLITFLSSFEARDNPAHNQIN